MHLGDLMSTILFPRKGDRLRAHSVFFQTTRVAASGIGVVSGMAPSRSSASAIAVASGTYRNGNSPGTYAGGSLTSIPAASSGKLRFDLVVFDVSDTTLKRIAGTEDTPPLIGEFLENSQPLPPELGSSSQILLAIIRVSSSGIDNTTHGHYATAGVANMIIEVPAARNFEIDFPFGDGVDVIESQVQEFAVPVNCKITRLDIWEVNQIVGGIACDLYIHDIGAANGSVVKYQGIPPGASYYTETGLNISVGAHKVLRIVVGSTTTAKQIVMRLFFEAT